MGENGKAHRKSKKGGKALKAAKRRKQKGEAAGGDDNEQVALACCCCWAKTPPPLLHTSLHHVLLRQAQARKQNPKAFVFSSRGKAKIQAARTAERDQRRLHVPVTDKGSEEPPPYTVLVQVGGCHLSASGGRCSRWGQLKLGATLCC